MPNPSHWPAMPSWVGNAITGTPPVPYIRIFSFLLFIDLRKNTHFSAWEGMEFAENRKKVYHYEKGLFAIDGLPCVVGKPICAE